MTTHSEQTITKEILSPSFTRGYGTGRQAKDYKKDGARFLACDQE